MADQIQAAVCPVTAPLTATATPKHCIPQPRLASIYGSGMSVTSGDTKWLTLVSREEHRAPKLPALEQDMPMAELLRAAIAELREDGARLRRVSKRAG